MSEYRIDHAIDLLEEIMGNEYGVSTKEHYDSMVIALDEFEEVRRGAMEHNDMRTDSRCMYSDLEEIYRNGE